MSNEDILDHGRRIADLERRVAEQSGSQIEAIKLYRELTGVGLAEAKNAVDRIAGG